jgi:MFS family permease
MIFAMAGRSEGMSSGSAIAAVSTVGYLGFLIVPPLVGSVAQLAGLRSAYAMMAGFGVLITILVRFALDKQVTVDAR